MRRPAPVALLALLTACGPVTLAADAGGADGPAPPDGPPAAWLDGWSWRRPLVISHQGEPITDQQLFVDIATDGLMTADLLRSDRADLRVTAADGTTELPHWEETAYLGSSRLWVRVPLVENGTTLYLYAGNPDAAMTASGSDTFEVFDDFAGDQLGTQWTADRADGGAVSVSNGQLHLTATTGSGMGFNVAAVIGPVLGDAVLAGARLEDTDTSSAQTHAELLLRSTATGYHVFNGTWASTGYLGNAREAVFQLSDAQGSVVGGAAMDASSGGSVMYLQTDAGDTFAGEWGHAPIGTITAASQDWAGADARRLGLSASSYAPAFVYSFDWVFVAKLASPMPVLTKGPEERR
jgi:hypothetical protein